MKFEYVEKDTNRASLFCTTVISSLLVLPTLGLADRSVYKVPTERAKCILEHRDVYLASEADVLLIVVENCPDPSVFVGADRDLQNYGSVSNVQTGVGEQFDPVISYTSDELRCLTSDSIVFEGEIAFLPKTLKCVD